MSNPLRQALEDWHRAGVTELPPVDDEIDFASLQAQSDVEASDERHAAVSEDTGTSEQAVETTHESIPASKIASEPEVTTEAVSGSAGEQLAQLQSRVAACTKCQELAEARTQTVFGIGAADADIMFIGEAPGADEDQAGEPFVGRAGQLLDKIIVASGWQREDLYICNILRCRPPGNRNPTPVEAANCREYLDGQIAAVNPSWIVCWGSVAAKNLLDVDRPIGRMRKQLFDHGSAKVLCTYHPSYLLRNPAAKKDVWDDLQYLFSEMGHVPPSRKK